MNDNVDEFVFIWLRTNAQFNDDNEEKSMIEDLRQHFNSVNVFDDADACVNYILSLPNEVIFLRLGRGWSFLIPLLRGIDQIHCIYLSEPSTSQFDPRVRGVFRHVDQLADQWTKDTRLFEDCLTHLTSCEDRASRLETSTRDPHDGKQSLLWSRLLLTFLIESEPSNKDALQHFLDEVRRHYQHNDKVMKQINEFERDYTPQDAIRWYTEDSFVYRMINKALRTQNITIIYKCRSLIRDIHNQLKTLQEQQGPLSSEKMLYRAQFIAPVELDRLRKNVGGIVSLNTFISTSVNRDVTMMFLDPEGTDKRFQSVLFEYIVDPSISLSDLPPFANVSGLSQIPDEGEVLLSIGMGARIESITPDAIFPRVHCIRLRLCSEKDLISEETDYDQWKKLFSAPISETDYIFISRIISLFAGDYKKCHQLSSLLPQTDRQDLRHFESCLDIGRKLINSVFQFEGSKQDELFQMPMREILTNLRILLDQFKHHPDFADVYKLLAPFPDALEHAFEATEPNLQNIVDFVLEIEQFFRLADLKPELFPSCMRSFLSEGTNSLLVWRQVVQGNFEYNDDEEDTSIQDGNNDMKSLLKAVRRFTVALGAKESGNDDRAIESYQRAIAKPMRDELRAVTLNDLAGLYEKKENWPALLSCCEDLLLVNTLPPNSQTIIEGHRRIGKALESMERYDEALDHYRHALDLHRQHHSTESPLTQLLEHDIKQLELIIEALILSLSFSSNDE